jgi:PKD repeat protein
LTYFIDKSTIADGGIIESEWNYGDGTYDDTGMHIFSEPGEYQVQLTAISDQGCRDSIQKTIEIKPTPFAGFDLSPSCVGSYTYFVDTSRTETYNPIIQWLWDFGDQITSSLQHPEHQYQYEGLYCVKLQVNALNGCYDTTSQNITVSSRPIANFGYNHACVGQPIVLYDSTAISNGSIIQWQWYVGNNLFSVQQNPTLIINNQGSYPITFIVTSNTQCSDSITKFITVHSLPYVKFEATPMYGAVPLTVSFNNLSDEGTFLWQFGDGQQTTLNNPVHVFSDTGNYTVCLTMTDEYGCSNQFCKNILVSPMLLTLL